jgi:predicted secreted Zn-dependent protease
MLQMEIVGAGADWRKASYSVNNGACVEVASAPSAVVVRDSVDPAGPVVSYSARTWQRFLATAKADTFNVVR